MLAGLPRCAQTPKKFYTRKPLPTKQPLQRGEYQALTRLLGARAKELKLSVLPLE